MEGSRPYEVVVAEPYDPPAIAHLEQFARVNVLPDSGPDTLLAAVGQADALLIRAKAHITARIIDAAPRLKVIARASPTVDHIDLRAVQRRNISVVYAPHVAVTSTAEFTLAMILALHRRILFFDHQVRQGKFDVLRQPAGRELGHQTLGLLGIDPVAEVLGRMCSAAFALPIIFHDPAGCVPTDFQAKAVDLDELLASCDILSIHLPLTPATKGLLNAQRIARLKPTAIIVNTARGAIIDNIALAQALRKRQIAGAALDVFDIEPLPADHPLRFASNCILTPHVAGATLDASAQRFNVAEDVIRVLRGEPPRHLFEPPVEKA